MGRGCFKNILEYLIPQKTGTFGAGYKVVNMVNASHT